MNTCWPFLWLNRWKILWELISCSKTLTNSVGVHWYDKCRFFFFTPSTFKQASGLEIQLGDNTGKDSSVGLIIAMHQVDSLHQGKRATFSLAQWVPLEHSYRLRSSSGARGNFWKGSPDITTVTACPTRRLEIKQGRGGGDQVPD